MADMMVQTPPGPSLLNTQPIYRDAPATPSRDRLLAIVGRLDAEANSRVSKRQSLEQRWIEDLEQYHGEYDYTTDQRLRNDDRSRVFLNMTRRKTDDLGSRIKDLIYPTDDKCWSIEPTPVPELTDGAEAAVAEAAALQKQADEAQKMAEEMEANPEADPQQLAGLQQQQADTQKKADDAQAYADQATDVLSEARKRSENMAREMDDQLTECVYQAVKRDQIDCAMKLGTGVTKGPVTGDKVRRGWKPNDDGTYALQLSTGKSPAFRYVDIWGFFPDMDAKNINEGKGVYERTLLNSKGLRELSLLDGYDKDAIRRLLALAPSTTAPSYLASLRNIRAATTQVTGDLYHVWEYTGPLEAVDMQDLAVAMANKSQPSLQLQGMAALEQLEDVDILQSVNACVVFCQGEILKFAVYPMDSGESMYSVFNLVKDEASIFGYGMPSLIRDPQAMINGAARAMMENAGVAAGPQVIIDKQNMEPEDGSYKLYARKVWLAKNGLTKENPPFQLVHIEMHQVELGNIIALGERMLDTMSSMPLIAQGEQGVGVTKTAQGMALLMNSSNVGFRGIVKNYDDDVTVPDMRRLYDFNMQHSQKPEIKGDYQVNARGSSVLLVREMQAQNLMMIALQLGAHPIYGPMLKNREILKKLFQAHLIPSDEVMLKDSEIDAVLARAAKENAEMQALEAQRAHEAELMKLEYKKIDTQIAVQNGEWHSREKIAKLQYDQALSIEASRRNMTLDQLETQLGIQDKKDASAERKLAVEVAMEDKLAREARAAGQTPTGSGGTISAGATPKKKGKAK